MESMIAGVENATDLGGKFWIFDGIAAVALDESDDHVFAPQRGQQILCRGVHEGISRGLRRNRGAILGTRTGCAGYEGMPLRPPMR